MHGSGPPAEPPSAGENKQSVANEHDAAVRPEIQVAEVKATETDIYIPSNDGALWCCEILSGVMQYRRSFASLRAIGPELETIVHPHCIVVSQDCDLEQDFAARQSSRLSSLPSIMLCEVSSATDLRGNVAPGRDIWKRIIQNKDERYQFLRAVPVSQDATSEGIPDLGIDFRRCFSIPTDELYEQFNLGVRRRCRLASPYKEHFMIRFAHFIGRVGLPSNHYKE